MSAKKAEATAVKEILTTEPAKPMVPMGHLAQKSLTLYDKAAQRKYHPLGPTTQHVVGEGAFARVVMDYKPEVQFQGHIFKTDDPEVAMAMIEDKVNFEKPWGFHVNDECLPEELAGKLTEYAIENRRIIMRALIAGKTAAEAMNEIIPELQEQRESQDQQGKPKRELMCPIVDCGKVVPEGAKNARAALVAHVRTQHPEFEGSIG